MIYVALSRANDTDLIENTTSNSYSVAAYVCVAAGMCLPGRYLAKTVFPGSTIPIFRL
jgi:hypothetical protein